MSRRAAALLALLVGSMGSACSLERLANRVQGDPGTAVSAQALDVHATSLVVDLHADSLLWGRDLSRHSSIGHADLPRLREGNVALQMFTLVTHVPLGMSIERTDERWPDVITLFALIQRWPRAAWSSRLERALHQIERLEALAAADPHLRIVTTRRDLEELLVLRAEDPRWLGALIGIEGAQALDGDPANLDRLVDRGLRMVGLAHFFDNEFAGSAHGRFQGGLTGKGRDLLDRMQRRGVVVDLAHSSPATIDEVLARWRGPTVVSHTGVCGTCDNPRNLSDAQVRAIAAGGGVIAVGFWETAVCGSTAADVARAVGHVVDLVGDRHAALGSDFDGAVTTPFDASGLPRLTAALVESGLPERSVRRVLGENAVRVLREVLPSE